MTWVLVIAAGWVLLAALAAVVIGRSVRLADVKAAAAAEADEPNFVVDPATPARGLPPATVLHFPVAPADDSHQPARPIRDTPTLPGIPVARPPVPGEGGFGGMENPIHRSGSA